jgi:DNA-binding PadR family transcriptional regulator
MRPSPRRQGAPPSRRDTISFFSTPTDRRATPSTIINNVKYIHSDPAAVLGDFEQLVLLAMLRLGPEAYGATIRREIEARTGRDLAMSAVYVTLERLEGKGFVRSRVGEPTAQRGGRRRKHFVLVPAGRRALAQAYRTFKVMVDGLEEQFDKS